MQRLCLDLPDALAGIFDVAAAKAHAPRDAYMRICLLTGLAEQMRFNGHGAVANAIAELAKEMMRQHPGVGISEVTVMNPMAEAGARYPEVRTGRLLVQAEDED
jgi:hypothetical protein